MNHRGVQRRLAILAVVSVTAVAVALSVSSIYQRLSNLQRLELISIRASASQLAVASEFALQTQHSHRLAEMARAALTNKSLRRVRIVDSSGNVVVTATVPNGHPHETTAWRSMGYPSPATLHVPVLARTDGSAGSHVIGWVELDVDVPSADAALVLVESLATVVPLLIAGLLLGNACSKRLSRPPINRMGAIIQAGHQRQTERTRESVAEMRVALHRRDVENAALARDRARVQQACHSQTRLLADLGHDTRSVVNAILGFASLLSPTNDTVSHRECVDTLRRSARTLLSLLEGLPSAKPGKMALRTSSVDLDALLSDVHALFAPAAYARGVEYHTEFPHARATRVLADSLRLRQILINLAGNAVKFTHQGHVVVSAKVTRKAGNRHWLQVSVQDTGPGMPSRTQRSLSEPMACRPVDVSASGLGLRIVKQAVTLMRGTITVCSASGPGTRIVVSLPLQLDRPPMSFAKTRPLPAVLAEDYAGLSRHRQRFLEQAGLTLVSYPAGETGVVLVDLTARRLRDYRRRLCGESRDGSDWPRIAYCSTYDPTVLRRIGRAGYAGVLIKGGSPSKFRRRLDGILNVHSRPRRRPPARRQLPAGVAGRLLIVDDDPVNRNLIRQYCHALGLGVDCASSASDAMGLMHRTRYKLIVTDLRMPAVGGRELASNIRRGPQRDAAIVALTADTSQDRTELRALGIDGILLKPVSLRRFRRCVARHVACDPTPARDAGRNHACHTHLRTVLRRRLPRDRATLASFARCEQYAGLAFAAHKLYGATLYCDVPALSDAVLRLEGAARSGDNARIAPALAEAVASIDRFLAAGHALHRSA